MVSPPHGRAGRGEGQRGQPVDWCLCRIGVTIRGSTVCCRRLGQARRDQEGRGGSGPQFAHLPEGTPWSVSRVRERGASQVFSTAAGTQGTFRKPGLPSHCWEGLQGVCPDSGAGHTARPWLCSKWQPRHPVSSWHFFSLRRAEST